MHQVSLICPDPGSSPRMRGTRRKTCNRTAEIRIIPAHAGNTYICSASPPVPQDHPRACGEHQNQQIQKLKDIGSSPRMRGTRRTDFCCFRPCGIIPAHAGNTPTVTDEDKQYRDHPRACGEHLDRYVLQTGTKGSSPRMRGTLGLQACGNCLLRIIPAHAGNTEHCSFVYRLCRDHPRACGEHPPERSFFMAYRGSSPRMRGTP